MTNPHEPLQFDSAVPAQGTAQGMTCANCKRPITTEYYEIARQVVCADCKGQLEKKFGLGVDDGAGPLARAFVFGALAAVGGAVLYLAVAILLHIELALLAILVGWMVGKAVRYGSRGRGGRRYQVLALLLTYFAISVSYVPQLSRIDLGAGAAVGIIVALVIAPIKVVLTQLPGSILSLIIIGVGMAQAWRMNGRVNIAFKGPFRVAASPPSVPNA
jgi:hypothetical protein